MANGKPEKLKPEEEDDDFDKGTINSDYLMISGNISSTVRSDITSISRSYVSVIGTDFTEPENQRSLSIEDPEKCSDDMSDTFDELRLKDQAKREISANEPSKVGTNLCSNCIVDGIETDATHFCESCQPSGKYICHKCLQGHNRWSFDHSVVSLSVDKDNFEREETKPEKETNQDSVLQDSTEKIISDVTKVTSFQELVQNETEKTTKQKGQSKLSLEAAVQASSGNYEHPKIRMLKRGFSDTEVSSRTAKTASKPRFYKDELLCEITKDQRYKNPSQISDKSLKKYGSYSVRFKTDTKRCFITGICQFGDGRIILTDSENCRIKVMDPNTFQVTASHKLESNPSLICYVKGSKAAVAFASGEIAMIEILDDITIIKTFKTKYMIKGIAYGIGGLYVCNAYSVEVYNETGGKKSAISLVNEEIKTKCLSSIICNENGDILFVADKEYGIIVADEQGHILRTISENLDKPNTLCLSRSGTLFATETHSDRVLKLDPDNGSVEQVLRDVNEKDHPISLCHERKYNRLILGVWNSDYIHVFYEHEP